jgi:hypothetical protein
MTREGTRRVSFPRRREPRPPGAPRGPGGRPRKDAVDQEVVNVAAFITEILETGPQQARDLAVAWLEGQEIAPTGEMEKLFRGAPRRAREAAAAGAELVSFVLPPASQFRSEAPRSRFEHRAEAIRRKGLKPKPEIVRAYVAAFYALAERDMPALVQAYLQLFPRLFRRATEAPPR